MIRKTFTFSEDTVKKIDERDQTLYRKEYQFVEAAIQFYSEHYKKEEENILKEIYATVKKIEQAVCKNSEAVTLDEEDIRRQLERLLD